MFQSRSPAPAALAFLALAVLPSAARADLVVKGVEFAMDPTGTRREQPRTVVIHARGIRLDQGAESHLVDLQRRQMTILDHRLHTARVLPFDTLAQRTAAARKDADEALARARQDMPAMPPAMKAQVEAAIRAQKDASAARTPGAYQRVPTGVKRTVNGFACDEVKELLNKEWVGTSCVHHGMELTRAEKTMLTRLAEEMARAGLSGGGSGEFTRAFLDGIPVELASRDYRTGKLTVEEQVQAVERRDVPATAFDIPTGYRTVPWDAPGPPGRGAHAGHGH